MLSDNEVTRILRAGEAKPEDAFAILQSLCWQASCGQEAEQPHVQELVLRALDQREVFRSCGDMLNGLVRHLGLYPYLNAKELGLKDAIARELHRPSVMAGELEDGQEDSLDNEKGLDLQPAIRTKAIEKNPRNREEARCARADSQTSKSSGSSSRPTLA